MKYILVTGAVLAEFGSGVIAGSIGVMLRADGYRVSAIKIDPLRMVDDKLASFKHGEVFVLKDGAEVDKDVGIYERFLNVSLSSDHYITCGKITKLAFDEETECYPFEHKVDPFMTSNIRGMIEDAASKSVDDKEGPADVCVIELGSNVGDYEAVPFMVALRQISTSVGSKNFVVIDVTLLPLQDEDSLQERHMEPTQFKIQQLESIALRPHLLVCLSPKILPKDAKSKISEFCKMEARRIVTVDTDSNKWSIPKMLKDQKAHTSIKKLLALPKHPRLPILSHWTMMVERYTKAQNTVHIAIVVKHVGHTDSYLSIVEAILHACVACSLRPSFDWIAASDLWRDTKLSRPEDYAAARTSLKNASCVLVPGGFGDHGLEGMMSAAKYARKKGVPFLGIGLGMQAAVISFARTVSKLKNANSLEFDSKTPYPVVVHKPEGLGLGSQITRLERESLTSKLYGNSLEVDGRHRNRYMVNPRIISLLAVDGLICAGTDKTRKQMHVLELRGHSYYIGVIFHPEFDSRLDRPSPLFKGLVEAAVHKNQSCSAS